ncbi:MAG: hypothetical protein L0Y44_15170 [Phycisphaerales bacterium]|nr:hypothetical protein [Phycisphaerales bacterium]
MSFAGNSRKLTGAALGPPVCFFCMDGGHQSTVVANSVGAASRAIRLNGPKNSASDERIFIAINRGGCILSPEHRQSEFATGGDPPDAAVSASTDGATWFRGEHDSQDAIVVLRVVGSARPLTDGDSHV